MIKAEIYCNKCGKRLDPLDVQEEFSFHKRLGYGSKYDMRELNLDLCCDCMDKIIDECVIPPIETEGDESDLDAGHMMEIIKDRILSPTEKGGDEY